MSHPNIEAPKVSIGGSCPCCRCSEGNSCYCHIRERDLAEAVLYLLTTRDMLTALKMPHTAEKITNFLDRLKKQNERLG